MWHSIKTVLLQDLFSIISKQNGITDKLYVTIIFTIYLRSIMVVINML